MSDKEIIAKEIADTYIYKMKKKNEWLSGEAETREIRQYLEECIQCLFEEIDNVYEVCRDAYADDLPDMRQEYHLKKKYPTLEQLEKEAFVTQVLKPQMSLLNRR